jgi:hypothetical protein
VVSAHEIYASSTSPSDKVARSVAVCPSHDLPLYELSIMLFSLRSPLPQPSHFWCIGKPQMRTTKPSLTLGRQLLCTQNIQTRVLKHISLIILILHCSDRAFLAFRRSNCCLSILTTGFVAMMPSVVYLLINRLRQWPLAVRLISRT